MLAASIPVSSTWQIGRWRARRWRVRFGLLFLGDGTGRILSFSYQLVHVWLVSMHAASVAGCRPGYNRQSQTQAHSECQWQCVFQSDSERQQSTLADWPIVSISQWLTLSVCQWQSVNDSHMHRPQSPQSQRCTSIKNAGDKNRCSVDSTSGLGLGLALGLG